MSANCARPAGASVALHWRRLQRRAVVVAVATMVRASALRIWCACPAGASVGLHWRCLQRGEVIEVVVVAVMVAAAAAIAAAAAAV